MYWAHVPFCDEYADRKCSALEPVVWEVLREEYGRWTKGRSLRDSTYSLESRIFE